MEVTSYGLSLLTHQKNEFLAKPLFGAWGGSVRGWVVDDRLCRPTFTWNITNRLKDLSAMCWRCFISPGTRR